MTIGNKDGYPQIAGKDQVGTACAPRSGSMGGGDGFDYCLPQGGDEMVNCEY